MQVFTVTVRIGDGCNQENTVFKVTSKHTFSRKPTQREIDIAIQHAILELAIAANPELQQIE